MVMRWLVGMALLATALEAAAASQSEIAAMNSRGVVFLQVENPDGGVVNSGSGFIVSQEGHIITVAHLTVDPTQKMMAVIGQRQGTKFELDFREADAQADVALWQLPQSTSCRSPVTLTVNTVKILDRLLVLGFPGSEGLSASSVGLKSVSSQLGLYKVDGFLEGGNSGGPAFNDNGQVIGLVQGGTLPGTENNDLIPIAPAITLIQKRGVRAGIDTPVVYDSTCYATCRHPSHGVASWKHEEDWGPVNTGWLSSGHGQESQCAGLIAGALSNEPYNRINLLPGANQPGVSGMWEEVDKDIRGTRYRYFCKGKKLSGPEYVEKQSAACGLWQ